MTPNPLRNSARRGALFGALMLSTEEAANWVVNQPPLSGEELSQILLWYTAVMALLGLGLSVLKQPLAHHGLHNSLHFIFGLDVAHVSCVAISNFRF